MGQRLRESGAKNQTQSPNNSKAMKIMHWPNNWRKEISNGVTMTMKSNVKFVFIQFLFASCELKLLLC